MKAFSFATFHQQQPQSTSINSSTSSDGTPRAAEPVTRRASFTKPFTRCVKDIKSRTSNVNNKHKPLGTVVPSGGFSLRKKNSQVSKEEFFVEDGSFVSHREMRNDIFNQSISSNILDHGFFETVEETSDSFHTPFKNQSQISKKTPKTTATIDEDNLNMTEETEQIVRKVRSLHKDQKERLFRLVTAGEDELDVMVRQVDTRTASNNDVSFQFDQLAARQGSWTPSKESDDADVEEEENFFEQETFGINVFRGTEDSIVRIPPVEEPMSSFVFPEANDADDFLSEDDKDITTPEAEVLQAQNKSQELYRVRIVEMVGSYQELSPGRYHESDGADEASGALERRLQRSARVQEAAALQEDYVDSPPPSESFNMILSKHYERYCAPDCENPITSLRNIMFQSDDSKEDEDDEFTERIAGGFGYGVYTDKEVADVIRNPSKHVKQATNDAAVVLKAKSEDLGRSTRETVTILHAKSEEFGESLRDMSCNKHGISAALPELVRSVSEVGNIADAPIDDDGVQYLPAADKVNKANRNWKDMLSCSTKNNVDDVSICEARPTVDAATPRIRNSTIKTAQFTAPEPLDERVLSEEPLRARVIKDVDVSGGELYVDESLDNIDIVDAYKATVATSPVLSSSPAKPPSPKTSPSPRKSSSVRKLIKSFNSNGSPGTMPLDDSADAEKFKQELNDEGLGYC